MSKSSKMGTNPLGPVTLAISRPDLEEQLRELLDSPESPTASEPTPAVVIRDGNGKHHPNRPVIRLWNIPRQRRNVSGENPFLNPRTIGWVGASPQLDVDGIQSTLNHLRTGRFLSLTELLAPDAKIVTARETRSAQKALHQRRMQTFFDPLDLSHHLLAALRLALEEMYTNAVFNAPVDETGCHLNAACSRGLEVATPSPFSIRFGRDEHFAAISVCDWYGSLHIDRITSSLARCYDPGGAVFEDKQGGAGLGLFMILQEATRLVINLKAGQFTEMIFLRRLNERRRDFMRSCPTMNLCVVDGEKAIQTSRRYIRRPVEWPASFECHVPRQPALILDVSERGAFVHPTETDQAPAAVGDRIQLTFTPGPGKREQSVPATVRWCGRSNEHLQTGFGVEFEQPIGLVDFSQ